MVTVQSASFWGVLAAAALLGSCTMDPVAATAEDLAERTEDQGFKADSEYHRPGQPCGDCHGPRGSADSKFVISGTVYWGTCNSEANCSRLTVPNAEVRLRDSRGSVRCVRTNCAGNFFIREGEWQSQTAEPPLFPLLTTVRKVTDEGQIERIMASHVGRANSCNSCHQSPVFWNRVGQIYLVTDNSTIPASARAQTCPAEEPSPIFESDCEVVGARQ
jgi:hypothetical protein